MSLNPLYNTASLCDLEGGIITFAYHFLSYGYICYEVDICGRYQQAAAHVYPVLIMTDTALGGVCVCVCV